MAAPAITAALVTGWYKLPAELHEKVVNHLKDNRAALENVIASDGPATNEALRLYWSTATPINDLFAILRNKPFPHRQFFANFLRGVTIEFKAPGEHHEGRGLHYPRLQSLTVVHDQVLMGRESCTYARIRRFMSARLRHLEIGCHLHEGMDVIPTTDNFLPALGGCLDLRSLTLRARVKGATSEDLVDVLNNCTMLRSLKLERCTQSLIDESSIQAIAAHPAIRFLEIDKHLDVQLVSLVANVPQPFKHITDLRLCIDTSAVRFMLPHMANLVTLELTVFSDYGTSSIFPYLRTLTTLKSLYLKFHNKILRDEDLSHLASLKQLESLELSEHDDEKAFLNTSMVRSDLFAAVLGSLPCLDSFTLNASHAFGDGFLIALGRGCHALGYLTLPGPFTLEPLSRELGVLFPCLRVLELGRVDSTLPLRNWGGFREAWAGGIARSLLRHAPQLQQMWLSEDGDRGMGDLVQETWEEMVEERDSRLQ
ncbi:hypothetical protein KCU99_g7488, partial [Aureobasidium melanogenum]